MNIQTGQLSDRSRPGRFLSRAQGLLPGAALLLLVLLLHPGAAESRGFPNARWKAEEQRCIAACPSFPRFSGTETPAQYQRRIAAENAYNRCYARCIRQYQERVLLPREPYDDGSQGYLRRNGGN